MSKATNSPALARSKDKVVGRHVEIHEKRRYFGEEDPEEIASTLNSFFGDYKPLDNYEAEVIEETVQVCSLCGTDWDPVRDDDSGVLICSYCGVPIAQ
jgi:hypothetical protein